MQWVEAGTAKVLSRSLVLEEGFQLVSLETRGLGSALLVACFYALITTANARRVGLSKRHGTHLSRRFAVRCDQQAALRQGVAAGFEELIVDSERVDVSHCAPYFRQNLFEPDRE